MSVLSTAAKLPLPSVSAPPGWISAPIVAWVPSTFEEVGWVTAGGAACADAAQVRASEISAASSATRR